MREAEMALIDVTINALVLVVICLPPLPLFQLYIPLLS